MGGRLHTTVISTWFQSAGGVSADELQVRDKGLAPLPLVCAFVCTWSLYLH